MTKSSKKNKTPKTSPSKPLQETYFEPVKIDIQNPHNLLFLLKCEDYKVQVQALYHLRKYLSKANNLTVELMMGKNILDGLLPLLKNQDLCIRKLVYAILSTLIDHSSVRYTLQDKNWTEPFVEAFFKRDDLIILENVLKIFSYITEDEIGKSLIADSIPLEKISPCLDIDDPDIKKYTLKTILNYLNSYEPVKKDWVKMETLVKLIDSEYPVIQHLALDVLTSMMKRPDGIEAQLKFKQLGGFNKLMNYLENPDYEDVHTKILDIFGCVTNNEMNEIMEANTLRRLLLLSRKILNVDKLERLWNTIIRLANSKKTNQILMDFNLMDTIKSFLHSSNERLIVVACRAISQLLKDLDQIENVLHHISIDSLTRLMEQNIAGRTKEAVMSTMLNFLKYHTIDEKNTAEMNKFGFILKILASSHTNMDVSMELKREIITCLEILAQNSFFRERLNPNEYIDHLIKHLMESEDDQLSIAILTCLSQLVYDDKMCQVLCDGYIQKLWEQLENNLDNNKVSVAVGQFMLIASSAQQLAANTFIRVGVLEWLIGKNKCGMMPVWQSVMSKLFENHLPAKFALYDRLDFADLIKDTFYAWRYKESEDKPFNELCPLYEDLHKLNSTEVETDSNIMYVVNLNQSTLQNSVESTLRNSVESTLRKSVESTLRKSVESQIASQSFGSLGSKRSSTRRGSEEEKISLSKHSSNETSKFALCGDPFMKEYVNELLENLKGEEKTAIIEEATTGTARNIFDTQNQIKILANFVCNQLSGTDKGVPCTKHYFDLHISDLETEVRSRMIPMGLLRLGLSFERALLFKMLADQIGLSCALIRGTHGHGWVEVAVTSYDKVPTHVVDLTHTPGKLMKLKTQEADEYTNCPKLIIANQSIKHTVFSEERTSSI